MKKLSVILLGTLLCVCIALLPMETQAVETDGYLTYTVDDGEVTITDCDEDATGKIVIPETIEGYPVTKIGEGAFWDCTGIKEIVVPKGITVIPDAAFRECETLEKITLPEGVTSIGNGAFSECEYLVSIDIPESVTSIGSGAFLACNKLSAITIPDGIQEIKDSTFAYCNSLTDVTIPDSVTTIGAKAFSGCPLSSDFVLLKNISSIGDGAFGRGCGITIPEDHPYFTVDEYGVLFNRDKTKLVLVLLPIDGKYEVPEGVQTIQGYAFAGCKAMTEIVFPDTVTKMGPHALSSIGAAHVRLPERLTVIESGLLITCKNLVSVYIPDSVTRIESEAFKACYELRDVRFSNNLQYIGEWAFDSVYTAYISLPGTMQEIAKGAFVYCSSIERVTFYGTREQWDAIKIGEHNDHLKNAKLTFQTAASTAPKEGYLSYYIANEFVTIIGCAPEASGEIVIPDTIQGYPVLAIHSRAFTGVANITKVVLPQHLTTIVGTAFAYSGVESIVIPDSVTLIGDDAFMGCWKLREVVIGSGVTVIPHRAFQQCGQLEKVTLSDSITTIQSQAFYKCRALKSIQLPAALTKLGQNAFRECESLTSVDIPGGLTEIHPSAFRKCNSLTQVFYGGDQTQWDALMAEGDNEELQNAQLIFHIWDEGAVSVEPTCEQEGVKVYTCTTCGRIKNTTIPMAQEHAVDTQWSTDASMHWHVCKDCNKIVSPAYHVPGTEATVDTPQTCTVCGYEIAPKLEREEPTYWVWIIVGAVVLLAGCATAAVIILKKKRQ